MCGFPLLLPPSLLATHRGLLPLCWFASPDALPEFANRLAMPPLGNKPTSSGSSTAVMYEGTGPGGRMLDPGKAKDRGAAKKAEPKEGAVINGQPRRRLVVKGSIVKSNLVHRHIENVDALIFRGRVTNIPNRSGSGTKSGDKPKGDEVADADIIVENDIVHSSVCETMRTKGLVFEGDDDEAVAPKGAAAVDVSSPAFQNALAENMDRLLETRYGLQLEQE
ncbi:hypothetical protein GQ53DRAFT_751835 [Thozetella sp. PMI_491]|nr:hypothetical protein GQ53DRAFT_751835 [Thozetella sp. PMI_491]